jgi:hypothetical protein
LVTTCLITPALSDEAVTAGLNGTVTLEWTAPGDDSLTGRATGYDLRYRNMPFTAGGFAIATAVSGLPAPRTAGSVERFTVTGLQPGAIYYFAIKTVDDVGNWSLMSNLVQRTASQTVGVEGGGVAEFAPPFPNPCRSTATFALNVPHETDVEVEAYDITGRHIATLAKGRRPAGNESLTWNLQGGDGRRLAAGVYLVRARIGTTRFVRRVIITG